VRLVALQWARWAHQSGPRRTAIVPSSASTFATRRCAAATDAGVWWTAPRASVVSISVRRQRKFSRAAIAAGGTGLDLGMPGLWRRSETGARGVRASRQQASDGGAASQNQGQHSADQGRKPNGNTGSQ
jgi:hypothetical protein